MTPAFRTAGKPALRKYSFALLLACTSALAGCATHTPPPEISYDNAAPAVQTVDPPSPVRIAYRLQPDDYRGGDAIQLVVVHLQATGPA